MAPTLSLAGHLEYLVSAPEDPGDRDKHLLDEWARSVIHQLCYLALYLTIRSQVHRRREQCVLLLTLTRLWSLGLMYTPSDFTLRRTGRSRAGRRMGHGIASPKVVSQHFRSAFRRIITFCYFVVCKLRTIYLFSSHLPLSSFSPSQET